MLWCLNVEGSIRHDLLLGKSGIWTTRISKNKFQKSRLCKWPMASLHREAEEQAPEQASKKLVQISTCTIWIAHPTKLILNLNRTLDLLRTPKIWWYFRSRVMHIARNHTSWPRLRPCCCLEQFPWKAPVEGAGTEQWVVELHSLILRLSGSTVTQTKGDLFKFH